MDGFLRWLAVNTAVDNWDAYGVAHNYYLYGPPGGNGRLVWIPWDNNYAFGLIPFVANFAGIAQRGAAPALQGPVAGGVAVIGSNDDVLFENVGKGWPLISRLLADPVYMSRYRAHLRFALGGLYERDRLAARIREWQTLLASSVKSDKPRHDVGRKTKTSRPRSPPCGLRWTGDVRSSKPLSVRERARGGICP